MSSTSYVQCIKSTRTHKDHVYRGPFMLGAVPLELLRTPNIYLKAVQCNWLNIDLVPEEQRTATLCLAAV